MIVALFRLCLMDNGEIKAKEAEKVKAGNELPAFKVENLFQKGYL